MPTRETGSPVASRFGKPARLRAAVEVLIVIGLIQIGLWKLCGRHSNVYRAFAYPAVACWIGRVWWLARRDRLLRLVRRQGMTNDQGPMTTVQWPTHASCSTTDNGKRTTDCSLHSRGPRPPWRNGWLSCLAITLLMSAGLIVLGALVRIEGEQFRSYWLAKPWSWTLEKLGVIVFQQIALHFFLWPRLREVFRHDRLARCQLAVVFGLLHLPSPALVALTAIGGYIWSWLYERTRWALPLIASHFLVAVLAYAALPARLNYNMGVGESGARVRNWLNEIDAEPLASIHDTLSSDAYYAACGDDLQYIASCFEDALWRPVAPDETAFCRQYLRAQSRAEFSALILTCTEFRQGCIRHRAQWLRQALQNTQTRLALQPD